MIRQEKPASSPLSAVNFMLPQKSRFKKDQNAGHNFHIVLLAMNKTGYRNLMKLATAAQTEGFYYKPRIDYELLAEHQEGLIALTACLHGEIPWRLTHNDRDGAQKQGHGTAGGLR